MVDDIEWAPPGPGVWWLTLEHMPHPVSGLLADVFPPVVTGWITGARRLGIARSASTFGAANHWLYYSPGPPGVVDDELVATAEATLADRSWREEVRRWDEEERPAVLAADRALQQEDPAALDDAALADHFDRAVAHYLRWAPVHFEHGGFDLAAGLLLEAAEGWSISGPEVLTLLAGASTGSTDASRHLDAIAGALRAAGVHQVGSLDEVRAHAAVELDEFLAEHGWRLLAGHDPVEPTLGEHPQLVLAGIRARLAGEPPAPAPPIEAVRARVPEGDRHQFDELLADARASYRLRDDDVQLTFNWPLGLVRRAVLVAADRLPDIADPVHLFEATAAELGARLRGAAAPTGDELADRSASRRAAAELVPPPQLGTYEPDDAVLPAPVARLAELQGRTWAVSRPRGEGAIAGTPVGTGIGRGRVRRVHDPAGIALVEPGDVLVARATTTAYGPVFPIVAAVVTEEGGLMGHTAILSRELGLPAVVGCTGALTRLADGEEVVVDGDTGVVTVVGERG